MTYDAFVAWLKATHPDVTFRGGRSITTRGGKVQHFLRATRHDKGVRFVCDEDGGPREITSAERKHLGNEKRGKRQPTKRSREAQERRGRRAPDATPKGKGLVR